MPVPDPIPPSPRSSLGARFARIMRWMAAFAVAVAALAVGLVARGDTSVHIHMLIATALGVGLCVLVGGALMSLVFLSNASGHDDQAAARHDQKDDDDSRP
jgi:hypothetical protein